MRMANKTNEHSDEKEAATRDVEQKVLNSPITTFIKSFLKVNIEPE